VIDPRLVLIAAAIAGVVWVGDQVGKGVTKVAKAEHALVHTLAHRARHPKGG